ncbi:4-(cytidine 5'-diphospho)-2-C-methyl-D-erythritol kinase [Comamonas faecalis]|uniref:4-diphosphocytidyl-2-C-methyl-D-erythritol kinase n=1 Tax=Comamonas faecalis TaxID=1387849 RepID=A0ABP7RB11_9BURK
MLSLYDVPAPAKLNLFLHITGRRADGYHLLQSVFMLIDWCDTLHFERRAGGHITREDLAEPLPADDLCLRAARALQAASGCSHGAHIGVLKRIPAQAGLGGGSSDAATTLLALNRLWNLGLTRDQLQAIGVTLGADVPFFLGRGSAWVEGIGDVVQPLAPDHALEPSRFVIVKPQAGLQTQQIFSHPLLKRDFDHATIAGFADAHRQAPYAFGTNALQPAAQALCPEIAQAIAWLQSQRLKPRMTGSGSAVFARLSHDFDLPTDLSRWQVKICDNLTLHPLADWTPDQG